MMSVEFKGGFTLMQETLDKHLADLGVVRDAIDDSIGELEEMKDTCSKAYEDLFSAREALSELI